MGTADAAKEYAAGLAAGVATVVTGHPFDTVKVKMQKHNVEAHGIKYKNALQCTTQILTSEGVRGLYRGATSSFIGMAFESSLLFGIYSQMKRSLQGEVHSTRPELRVVIPSAAYGGAIISFILCPSELVKCRMQVQGVDSAVANHGRYGGPLDCAIKTLKSEGIRGMFRGGFTTLLRESLGNAVFFSSYEYIRYYMHLHLDSVAHNLYSDSKLFVDFGIGLVSGGVSGIAYWSAVLPLDVAKTIIQTSSVHTSPFRTLSSIYRRKGIRGCYAGLGPTLVRAFPANAAAIVAWELAANGLGIKHN